MFEYRVCRKRMRKILGWLEVKIYKLAVGNRDYFQHWAKVSWDTVIGIILESGFRVDETGRGEKEGTREMWQNVEGPLYFREQRKTRNRGRPEGQRKASTWQEKTTCQTLQKGWGTAKPRLIVPETRKTFMTLRGKVKWVPGVKECEGHRRACIGYFHQAWECNRA